MKQRSHRLWALAPLLIVAGLGLAGCARGHVAADTVDPAQLKPVPGTSLHYVTLTQQALLDVGIRTAPVRRAPTARTTASRSGATTASPSPAARASTSPAATASPTPAASPSPAARLRALTAIPLAAVIYDPKGRPWTYTIAGPRTYVRKAIVIDRISGDTVLLRSGPPVGTPVVIVGASELLGAEYGVGEE